MNRHGNCKQQHFIADNEKNEAQLYLTQNKMATIDLKDLRDCLKYKWSATFDGFNWYVTTNLPRNGGRQKLLSLHRFLTKPKRGMCVDHINHNGLDNRRLNLKVCTHAENTANKKLFKNNSTGITGVTKGGYFSKRKNKFIDRWVAQFCRNYKNNSKTCLTFEEAIQARKEMEGVS